MSTAALPDLIGKSGCPASPTTDWAVRVTKRLTWEIPGSRSGLASCENATRWYGCVICSLRS
jgi:hypothetical protein